MSTPINRILADLDVIKKASFDSIIDVRSPAEFADLNVMTFVVNNLVPVTLGNIIGGGVFVGMLYWLIYLRD